MCDAHEGIIHDDPEVVHRHAILANNDKIATEIIGIPNDLSQNQIINHDLPVKWYPESVDIGLPLVDHGLDLLL
eukprot:Skav228016  [mRNA]  locus=scaffold1073:97010:98646:- [translate_table: standard]